MLYKILLFDHWNKSKIILSEGQWLWLSWSSGRLRHKRSAVRIQSSANFYRTFVAVNCIEKTKIKKKEVGNGPFKKIILSEWLESRCMDWKEKLKFLPELKCGANRKEWPGSRWTWRSFRKMTSSLSTFPSAPTQFGPSTQRGPSGWGWERWPRPQEIVFQFGYRSMAAQHPEGRRPSIQKYFLQSMLLVALL